MEKFCLFELHEYMDMYPSKLVYTFYGDDLEDIQKKASEYAKQMTNLYSGGPTTFIKVMTKEEASAYADKLIAEEMAIPNRKDKEFINNIRALYRQCYETVVE